MIPVSPSKSARAPLLVDLALQGGGAHGAFTWGVLDRLLEEPWLRIEGISGTSAGAMHAAGLGTRSTLDLEALVGQV
jgi:NTE family protein